MKKNIKCFAYTQYRSTFLSQRRPTTIIFLSDQLTTSISHQPMSRHIVNWQLGQTNTIIQVRLNIICGTWM